MTRARIEQASCCSALRIMHRVQVRTTATGLLHFRFEHKDAAVIKSRLQCYILLVSLH
jgi:gluconate kinase